MHTHCTQAWLLALHPLTHLVVKGASLLDNRISFCYKCTWLCHVLRLLAWVCLHAILWRGPWYILSVYIRIYCILHSPPCIRVDGCYSVYGVRQRGLYVSMTASLWQSQMPIVMSWYNIISVDNCACGTYIPACSVEEFSSRLDVTYILT